MNILDQEVILEFFRHNYLWFVATVLVGTFGLTFYLIPKVLWVTKEKNLMTGMNERSSHNIAVPSFGGVAFYMTIILVLSILQSMRLTYIGNHLIAAITILFMVGLKDDLVISTARVKLFGQAVAAMFLIFSPEMALTTLHGFLGIYEIPLLLSYFLKAFLVVALINAFNLIDGIDGLAAIVGIVISSMLAYIFYLAFQPYYVLVSISITGILLAYLRYNFSRGKNKIFMGDSGSLIIGLVLAFLSLKFLVMQPHSETMKAGYDPANRLLFLGCLLFIPIFDTLRVMILRKLSGNSMFTADKNHIHHVLLDLGLPHWKASLGIGILNLVVVWTFFFFVNKLSQPWLFFLIILLYSSSFLLFSQLKRLSTRTARQTIRRSEFSMDSK